MHGVHINQSFSRKREVEKKHQQENKNNVKFNQVLALIPHQSILQGNDGVVQIALHAHDVLSHGGPVELKPGQLSLVILQV